MQYKHHCITNLTTGTLLSVGLARWGVTSDFHLLFSGSFVFATFFLSPDLDLNHSSPARNWRYMRVLWWPYSVIFKHRGLSHIPIVGACTRLAYIFMWVCLGALIYDVCKTYIAGDVLVLEDIYKFEYEHVHEFFEYLSVKYTLCVSILAGVSASDLTHTMMDAVSSFFKSTRLRSR